MICREFQNHGDNCYFGFTKILRFSSKIKDKIEYHMILTAIRPLPNDFYSSSVPKHPEKYEIDLDSDELFDFEPIVSLSFQEKEHSNEISVNAPFYILERAQGSYA